METPADNISIIKPEPFINYNKSCKPVDQYTMDWVFIKTHRSAKAACREIGGASDSKIGDCCRDPKKSYKNFRFKFNKGLDEN
jgi:hypothetical protein